MELLDLFITSSIPVLKVLLITALGLFLALDRVDILGEDARKHLNNVVFYVFNPALVGSNLSETITYDSMAKLWFMPLNILLTFIVGSLLGWIVIQFTRPPTHLRGLVLGCCCAGNLGNMLLIIIPAVCKEKGSPFGSPETCRTYGMAYTSLSMAVGAIYLWTYVYNIVRVYSIKSTKETEINNCSTSKSSEETSSPDERSCTESLLASKESMKSKEQNEQLSLPCTIYDGRTEVTTSSKIKKILRCLFGSINLKTVFAPSTTGAIVGFLIGLIPQLRNSLVGDHAPLRVIQDSASLVGEGSVPTLTLVVGGNLLKGLRGSGVQNSIILGIVVARYVALPMIGVVIVRTAVRVGLVHSDPLYQFVLLIQYAVPPAMNIGVITQLFGAGESECSVILLWTYALASIALTLWSTFFLWLVA